MSHPYLQDQDSSFLPHSGCGRKPSRMAAPLSLPSEEFSLPCLPRLHHTSSSSLSDRELLPPSFLFLSFSCRLTLVHLVVCYIGGQKCGILKIFYGKICNKKYTGNSTQVREHTVISGSKRTFFISVISEPLLY